MKHTKEPWIAASYTVGSKDSGHIANTYSPIENGEANAQRIVDCVNALAGVADPASAIAAAREALEALLSDYYATLTAYNDYREFTDGIQPVEPDPSSEMARAALALLKGVRP